MNPLEIVEVNGDHVVLPNYGNKKSDAFPVPLFDLSSSPYAPYAPAASQTLRLTRNNYRTA